jgi:alpha-ketoglutarate-dependent taurine dioxygenase
MSLDQVIDKPQRPFPGRRQALAVGSGDLVRVAALVEASRAALCTPAIAGLNAREWVSRSDGLEELAAIRAAYTAEEIEMPWQAGDVIIVDNEQFTHGRHPYTGKRSILVAMT